MDNLRWGILSAGRICNDFVIAACDPTGPAAAHNKIVAIAARDLERARDFAEKHEIPTAYGSYEELSEDSNVDIVYVGNTNSHHYDVCKMMINAGKHVLCEKTLTLNYEQSKELFSMAKAKNLFLMEAVWSNFFPLYKEINRLISAGELGEVHHVDVSFGKDIQHVERVYTNEVGGGVALTLGCYCINLVRLVFQREYPVEIITRGDVFPSGVDAGWDVILVFSGNRRAVMKCTSKCKWDNRARISGSKGFIEIPDPFHCPDRMQTHEQSEVTVPLPNQPSHDYIFPNSAGLSYEVAAVYDAIRAGKLECEECTDQDTLYIAKMLDDMFEQMGVKFKDF